MDSETWQMFASEAVPLLRKFKELSIKYRLGTGKGGLNIAADEDVAWAFMIDDKDDVHYSVDIDRNDAVYVTCAKGMYEKGTSAEQI